MIDMQKILDNAVSSGDVPFIVSMTGNAAGITWSGVSGEAAADRKASLDNAFRIFLDDQSNWLRCCNDAN